MKKFLTLIVIATISLPTKSQASDDIDTLKLLDLFGNIFEKVRSDYVEEVTDKQLIEAAINGMLTDLDPHSSYLNFDDFKEMKEQTKGEFGGLGIEVTLKNGLVYVVAPIDDTPAFRAGLQSGDYISHINEEAVFGMTIGEAVKKMRGKPKTEINLKVIREGVKKPLDVTIIRDIIQVQPIKSKIYEDVGYIRLTSFTENVGDKMIEEIEETKKVVGKDELKGFVIDLRNNPGGLLNEAIKVSDAFMNYGEIVSTKGRNIDEAQKFGARKGDVASGLPIVVLINSGSASASEIVAGALQDHGRAVIVGEKSFGKGSVQTVIPVDGDAAIRLTTSRYYTPSGTSIQATGIEPDIIIEQAKLQAADKGLKTSEASLRGHLSNGSSKNQTDEEREAEAEKERIKEVLENLESPEQNQEGQKSNSDKDEEKALYEGDGEEDNIYNKDYQLARAIDMIRALSIYNAKK